MLQPIASPHQVPFDGGFRIVQAPTRPPSGVPDAEVCKQELKAYVQEMHELQRVLYAQRRYALLLVFQAMDAAGKDSTIRHVLSGVNPAGCQVTPFERPSPEELEHDFLWRTSRWLPRRGRIGVFNRSYYEEVLVVRVHPELLGPQRLPHGIQGEELWSERLQSIADHERHLARNGTVILKFWLNVSRDEQRRRFLKRVERPDKHWKFDPQDIIERRHWDAYMAAYEAALNASSRPWAPWYAIPADDKPYMRREVARIVTEALRALPLEHPEPDEELLRELARAREALRAENRDSGDGAAPDGGGRK